MMAAMEQKREWPRVVTAYFICAIGAATAVLAYQRSWAQPVQILLYTGCLFSVVEIWLGRRFNRQHWERYNQPLSKMWRDAKLGRLRMPQDPLPLALLSKAATLLMLTWLLVQCGALVG